MNKWPLLLLILSCAALAKLDYLHDISFGVGNLSPFYKEVQIDDNGKLNNFEVYPYLSIDANWDFYKDFSLLPELGISIPQKGRDPNIKRTYLYLNLPAGYRFWRIRLRAGMGMFMTFITGKGGTSRLNNGLGYDEYPVPSGTTVTKNVVANGGLQFYITRCFSLRADAYFLNIHNSKRANNIYALSLHYHYETRDAPPDYYFQGAGQ